MAVGIRIYSEDGSGAILLDNNLQNFFQAASATVATVANDVTQLGASKVVISYTAPTGGRPLIAVAPTGYTAMLLSTSISGNVWTWTFICDGLAAAPGASFPYYIYDIPPTNNPPGVGLKVFDSTGKLCFASFAKIIRIVDVLNEDLGTSQAYGSNHSYVSGRNYALIFGRYAGMVTSGVGFGDVTKQAMYGRGLGGFINTDGVSLAMLLHSRGPNGTHSSSENRYYGAAHVLVVDVTNY